NHRVGVKVVAGARLGIVLRHWIARAPDGEPRRRIVGPGLPETSATRLPRARLVLPGLAAGVAGLGDGVPPPQFFAGARIEPREPSAGRNAGTVRDQHLAVHCERRSVQFLPAPELVDRNDLLVPDDLAAVTIDGDDAAIRQVGEDEVFP